MNRCKISIGILLALVVLCVSALLVLHSQCGSFAAQTGAVLEAVQAGETERALAECGVLLERWDTFHGLTGLFVDGTRLDPMREILTGLPPLIAQEHPEVVSQLETLRALTQDIFEEEMPEWWHIL